MKRFKKVYGMGHPCSGGFRVNVEGIMKVCVEAIVLTGYHNERKEAHLVKPGYLFYSHFGFGAWTDVIPVWQCKKEEAFAFVSRYGDSGDARERKNKKFIVAKVDHRDL
jgi:hypothetical protein